MSICSTGHLAQRAIEKERKAKAKILEAKKNLESSKKSDKKQSKER